MQETVGIPRASQQDAAVVLLIAKGVHFPL